MFSRVPLSGLRLLPPPVDRETSMVQIRVRPPMRPPPRSCHKAQRPPYRWPFIRACLRQTPIPFLCSCRSRIAPRLSAVGGSAGLPASWPTPLTEYRFRCWVFSCRPHRKTAIWDGQRPVGIWERNRHRVPLCRKEGFPSFFLWFSCLLRMLFCLLITELPGVELRLPLKLVLKDLPAGDGPLPLRRR